MYVSSFLFVVDEFEFVRVLFQNKHLLQDVIMVKGLINLAMMAVTRKMLCSTQVVGYGQLCLLRIRSFHLGKHADTLFHSSPPISPSQGVLEERGIHGKRATLQCC